MCKSVTTFDLSDGYVSVTGAQPNDKLVDAFQNDQIKAILAGYGVHHYRISGNVNEETQADDGSIQNPTKGLAWRLRTQALALGPMSDVTFKIYSGEDPVYISQADKIDFNDVEDAQAVRDGVIAFDECRSDEAKMIYNILFEGMPPTKLRFELIRSVVVE
ncbi:hypothetical protein [Vibrio mediterranei]|uniref:hypothetical protein n=1 Tax=Vibrio mediterranei TaxID=689 RepID=UPI004067EDAD